MKTIYYSNENERMKCDKRKHFWMERKKKTVNELHCNDRMNENESSPKTQRKEKTLILFLWKIPIGEAKNGAEWCGRMTFTLSLSLFLKLCIAAFHKNKLGKQCHLDPWF